MIKYCLIYHSLVCFPLQNGNAGGNFAKRRKIPGTKVFCKQNGIETQPYRADRRFLGVTLLNTRPAGWLGARRNALAHFGGRTHS